MKEDSLVKLASEAAKPVSPFLDALLGPRIRRVKSWAEKRDRSDRLKSSQTAELLDQYLRRSLLRLSEITTIIFPLKSLPLGSIYEPLSLKLRHGRSDGPIELDPRSLSHEKNFVIVDSAGMGKSTFSKHLCLQILSESGKIPIFLELRRIEEPESLLTRLRHDIDPDGNTLDDDLVTEIFLLGNFVFVFDGYDEISEVSRKNIGTQITELAIRADKNCYLITTRPNVPLPELPHTEVLSIEPLNRSQSESLLLKYDSVSGMDIGKKLISELGSVPEKFLETPLLNALLYKTYGFNNSIAKRVSTFYDEIFNALYKGHDLTKSGFSRVKSSGLDFDDFRKLLRSFSFLAILKQQNNMKSWSEGLDLIGEASSLSSIIPTSNSNFLEDLLSTVPLLTRDGTDYRFIHKSLSEFFAAEYISYNLKEGDSLNSIINGNLFSDFANTFNFLSDIDSNLFRRSISKQVAIRYLSKNTKKEDSLVETIKFISNIHIGFWPDSYYDLKKSAQKKRIPWDDIGDTVLRSIHHLKIGKVRCTAIIIYDRSSSQILPSTWNEITEGSPAFEFRHYDPFEIHGNNIEDAIIFEKWYSVRDDDLSKMINIDEIQILLANAMITSLDLQNISPDSSKYHTISSDACVRLLQRVERDEINSNWISGLIKERSV